MGNRKHNVEVTKDNRRKADIIIHKAGFIEFTKDVVVRIEDEEFDNPRAATKVFLLKIGRDNIVEK